MTVRQTRRRGAELESAILDAAWTELSERGWRGFTIEGVSARSGAAKPVIYRRWRNRADLVQELLQRETADAAEVPQTSGDLRTDLVVFLRDMAVFLGTPFGEAVRGTMFEGDAAGRSSVLVGPVIVERVREIIVAAVGRGELRREPPPAVINLGHAMMMSEFLHAGVPASEEARVLLVDELWLPALNAAPPDHF